jgi:YD repeat-containing protein
MRNVCIATAVIASMACPAFAQSERKAQTQHAPQAMQYDGYGGKKRHTDPDPNVLFEMMRQRNWRKGG